MLFAKILCAFLLAMLVTLTARSYRPTLMLWQAALILLGAFVTVICGLEFLPLISPWRH